MRLFCAAAMIALLAGPANAQKAIPRYGDINKDKTPAEIAQEKSDEKAYKNSLGNIRDQGPTDPWGTVRSAPASNTTAKSAPAKSRAKNAGSVN
jgi:hypothetical protein